MSPTLSTTWNRMYDDLIRFVQTKVKDKATAEDIVQDVFLKVHTKSDQLKESEKVSAWIYQITRNAVVDHFRKSSKQVEAINLNWDNTYHEFNDCVSHCLHVLMDTLPDKYKVPLRLAEVENLGQEEIAAKLNISYSGARSRVQRARKMLKEKLYALYHIQTDGYGNVIRCEDKVPCGCSPNVL